jgi:uncharacterized protein with von Willebrand factor type A (vWA) domain
MTEPEYKGTVFVTKTRYRELNNIAKKYLNNTEEHERFMQEFRDIFKFDPDKKTSTEKGVERVRQKREKLKSEGISTYISSGSKKSYEKKKLLLL